MYSALLTLILCSICRNLDMSSWSVLHVSLFSYLYVPSGLASKSMNPGERKRRAFAHSALKSAAGFASRPSVYLRQGDAYRFSSSVRKRAHVNDANLNVQHTQSQSFPSPSCLRSPQGCTRRLVLDRRCRLGWPARARESTLAMSVLALGEDF